MNRFLQQLAYADFTTGSLLVQSLIGVIAGVSIFMRRSLRLVVVKIRNLFKRREQKQEITEEV